MAEIPQQATALGVTPGEQPLANLTVSWLARFIRQQLETNPVNFLESLGAEKLTAAEYLVANKEVWFPHYDRVFYVGKVDAAPFGSPWTNFGAGNSSAQYWRTPGNVIHIQGVIKPTSNAAANSDGWILPPEWRPPENKVFDVRRNNGTSEGTGRVDILSTGHVRIYDAVTSAGWVSLDGIHYKASKTK